MDRAERYRPLLDKLQNRQLKREWGEPLSPLELNELRADSHYVLQEIREDLEKNNIDSMVNRVMMRIRQPFILTKKIYCEN